MWIVKLMSVLFILFAAYLILDVIGPAMVGKPMFTLWRYIFKGKDYDDEVKEYNETKKD